MFPYIQFQSANFGWGFPKTCGFKNCASKNTLFSPNNEDVNIGLSHELFSDRQRSLRRVPRNGGTGVSTSFIYRLKLQEYLNI